jgi:hypothetical protein
VIRFPCPQCGKELVAAFEKEGRKAKCSGCKTVLIVPPPEADVVPEIPPIRAVESELVGFGGWLILPDLHLILSLVCLPLVIIFGAVIAFHFDSAIRVPLTLLSAYVGLTVYVAVAFFKRKKSAPKLMIVWYAAGAAVHLVVTAITKNALDPAEAAGVCLVSGIWIWYFLVSRRVKATFVNGSSEDADNQEEECILADIAAGGFAREEDTAYIFTGNSPTRVKRAWESFMLIPKQKMIIWTGIACLALLVLIVPWKAHKDYDAGYSFIFSPPRNEETDRYGKLTGRFVPYGEIRLDLPRIILPMFVVICATGAGAWLTREKLRSE